MAGYVSFWEYPWTREEEHFSLFYPLWQKLQRKENCIQLEEQFKRIYCLEEDAKYIFEQKYKNKKSSAIKLNPSSLFQSAKPESHGQEGHKREIEHVKRREYWEILTLFLIN